MGEQWDAGGGTAPAGGEQGGNGPGPAPPPSGAAGRGWHPFGSRSGGGTSAGAPTDPPGRDPLGTSVLGSRGVTHLVLVGGAVLVGMLLVAAVAVALRPETAPGVPYRALADLEQVTSPVLDVDRRILYVPADDGVRAFDAREVDIDYCQRSGRIESGDGGVWDETGAPLNGREPLAQHPTIVFEGVVYLDRTTTRPAPEGRDTGATPVCGGPAG